ncbi:DUF3604 domain-containing protein [Tropicimonas marinistellae]|uniref:DUF3604 domain-containing protein n=1 Tax=Tropicimonas marinistellae TaxID=1739787 RepID=UPI00083745B7|nr:DUF3604 domain-containing protein [Tropicimonas marinistellae]
MNIFHCLAGFVFAVPGIVFAQEVVPEATAGFLKGRPYSPYADRAFPERVFFGDTHVHTALSADAGGGGTRLMPRDAYRFARGEQVTSNTGQPVKLPRPFDFYMITDHSDGMGAITDILSGAPNILADEQGRRFHEAFNQGGEIALRASQEMTASFAQGTISPALNYQPGNPAYERVWDDLISIAEEFNQPGVFTTFAAFEWTSLVQGNNLHRNIILRDGPEKTGQIVPYTTTPPLGSSNPRDLYAWLQIYEDTTGGDALAIAHNGNLSNGWMFSLVDDFADGTPPLDRDYAEQRQKWEPLYEWSQYKGDGETHPLLSSEDEFADFETWDYGNLDASVAKTPEMLPGEYARSGLLRGLALQAELGVNPYKFGANAATDTHIGITTVSEDNFFSKQVPYEPSAERASHVGKAFADGNVAYYGSAYSAAGLTAVWARKNTRGAIFDAMERREAYATTGPRMSVRFFGGDYDPDALARRDLARIGYSGGVPMGGDLSVAEGEAPDFLVYSLRDAVGANLDRIQIVKGWIDTETGAAMERVYDVAWGGERSPGADGMLPPVGNTVDLSIPSWTNTIGSPELGAVWTDPDFDPAEPAFYYARVIEIPTPRWTAYDAVKFGAEMPEGTPMTTQDRAYTSPIWFTPD